MKTAALSSTLLVLLAGSTNAQQGTKMTLRGSVTDGGKKMDDYTDVWRKLSK